MEDGEIERVARAAAQLPGVEVSTWYGTPALKLRRGPKDAVGIARIREPGVLMALCPLELKEALIEAEPDVYFETDHYRGWPALLVRLDRIDDERLRDRLERAWEEKATPKLRAARESAKARE